ncbi:MAG: YicC/YloC family endoribonuclease [Candidatus Caldatribacteriota bacterium]|nr:YicC/YloC family endoribonuclease [Candidatus Caldatribacteriota bacterium]
MVRSMTGYGEGEIKKENQGCLIEIKTLNNRFCDINIKSSIISLEIDQKVEKIIKETISRGKVSVQIKVDSHKAEEEKVVLNENLSNSYYDALKTMKKKYKIEEEINLSSMLRLKDVFQVERTVKTVELWPLVETTLQKALDSLLRMREKEGKNLITDIQKRIKKIQKEINRIEKYSKTSILKYKNDFLVKLKKITEDINIDEGRVELEAAIFAEKNDINEEIIRTKSHIDQFINLLNSNQPVGRKMDFIIQEINREINTIGSKTNDLKISSLIIIIKSELEKIREQVRNIE